MSVVLPGLPEIDVFKNHPKIALKNQKFRKMNLAN